MKTPYAILIGLALIAASIIGMASSAANSTPKLVTYTTTPMPMQGYLCKPSGRGPFPLVVYNHGGMGNIVGGAPKETCEALARGGYVGLAPLRRQTHSMRGHINDVLVGKQYGQNLPYVDRRRVALIGFSRGGLLTLMAATIRDDLRALVVMAPAMGGRGQMDRVIGRLENISVPVLLMVAKNDTGSKRTRGQNTLVGSRRLSKALKAAERNVRFIEYPPYNSDGHTMFFGVGKYWQDVLTFLRKHV